jgi:hypothetical protein
MLAIVGWGAFLYASSSADAARTALRESSAKAEAERAQLVREHGARTADLQGRIAGLEQQIRPVNFALTDSARDVAQTGSVTPPDRSSASKKPSPGPGVRPVAPARPKTIADLLKE